MTEPVEKTCRRWNMGCGRCDLCCDEPIGPGYGGYYGTDPIPPELAAIPYIKEDWPPLKPIPMSVMKGEDWLLSKDIKEDK